MEMMAADMPNWSLNWLVTGELCESSDSAPASGQHPGGAHWAKVFAGMTPNAKIYSCGAATLKETVRQAYVDVLGGEAGFLTEAFSAVPPPQAPSLAVTEAID